MNCQAILGRHYLKVSDNNRFLVKENGEPFFWMGDTGWELIHKLFMDEIDYIIQYTVNVRAS